MEEPHSNLYLDVELDARNMLQSEDFGGVTDKVKLKALVDYYGMTEQEARAMLVDMGEIDPMEMAD